MTLACHKGVSTAIKSAIFISGVVIVERLPYNNCSNKRQSNIVMRYLYYLLWKVFQRQLFGLGNILMDYDIIWTECGKMYKKERQISSPNKRFRFAVWKGFSTVERSCSAQVTCSTEKFLPEIRFVKRWCSLQWWVYSNWNFFLGHQGVQANFRCSTTTFRINEILLRNNSWNQ